MEKKTNKRVLMTGMRKSGDTDFKFRINGHAAPEFPPLLLKMTLHDLQMLLHTQQEVPELEEGEPPRLWAVS